MPLYLTDTEGVRHLVPRSVERHIPKGIQEKMAANAAKVAEGEPPDPIEWPTKRADREAAIAKWAKEKKIDLPKAPPPVKEDTGDTQKKGKE